MTSSSSSSSCSYHSPRPLYAPGALDGADKVVVDTGTGYFIEKTMDNGNDYCQRKINSLKSNYEQLFEVLAKKKSVADEAGMVLQAKVRQLQAATTS
ncbi:BnaA02g32940D [Brassica napus]|uniref:(rape) hypothetical protein n=1 Tax=Brassica napus TaxID=3708 RepID=A0A078I9X5_BRANA|nr:unnamed protein product [Brassica napus]CDY46952.1 BnaA02g32940D [Brassica napus]